MTSQNYGTHTMMEAVDHAGSKIRQAPFRNNITRRNLNILERTPLFYTRHAQPQRLNFFGFRQHQSPSSIQIHLPNPALRHPKARNVTSSLNTLVCTASTPSRPRSSSQTISEPTAQWPTSPQSTERSKKAMSLHTKPNGISSTPAIFISSSLLRVLRSSEIRESIGSMMRSERPIRRKSPQGSSSPSIREKEKRERKGTCSEGSTLDRWFDVWRFLIRIFASHLLVANGYSLDSSRISEF